MGSLFLKECMMCIRAIMSWTRLVARSEVALLMYHERTVFRRVIMALAVCHIRESDFYPVCGSLFQRYPLIKGNWRRCLY